MHVGMLHLVFFHEDGGGGGGDGDGAVVCPPQTELVVTPRYAKRIGGGGKPKP